MAICKCGFKHQDPVCPICGEKVIEKKRKIYRIPARSNGRKNMAKIFREYILFRYPGYDGRPVPCDNCKMKISTIKAENISHIEPKSLNPKRSDDFQNLEILCGPMDYYGKKDESCHTLWERNEFEKYHKKKP